MIQNLVNLYQSSTDTDRQQGRRWYPLARRIVREWSKVYNTPIATVASVVAAVSPQCSWERNLIIADDILARRMPSINALRLNVDKAKAILDDCATSTLAYFPHGPKVASFAANLAGDDTPVTVDTHAIQAALNDIFALSIKLPWTHYQVVAQCYAIAAREVGYRPATFQAIIWCVWKRLYSPGEKRAILKRGKRT